MRFFYTILFLLPFGLLAQNISLDTIQKLHATDAERAYYLLDSMEAFSNSEPFKRIGWLSLKGKLLTDDARYDEAFRVLQSGFDLANDQRSDSSKAVIAQRLGTVNYRLDRKDKAINQLRYADSLARSLQLTKIYLACGINLGAIYTELSSYDLAEAYLTNALAEIEQNTTIPENYGPMGQRILATMYLESKQQEKALLLFRKVVSDARKVENKEWLASALIYCIPMMLELGRTAEALEMAEEAMLVTKNADINAHELVSLYDGYAMALLAAGKKDEAFEALRKSKNYEKEVFSTQLSNSVSELEVKHETGRIRKEKELAEERALSASLTLDLERRKNAQLIIGLIVTLLLAILSLLVFYYRNQRIKIAHENALQRDRLTAVIEGEERERSRLARELHDGIGQMLIALKMNLQEASIKDEASSKLLDRTFAEVRRVSHDLLPSELDIGGLIPALTQVATEVNSSGLLLMEVAQPTNAIEINPEVEKNLFRIAQEIISNALKHADATKIEVSFTQANDNLAMQIKDNGKGLSKEAIDNSNGIGWKNIAARLDIMQGKMDIDSPQDYGTSICITIPIA